MALLAPFSSIFLFQTPHFISILVRRGSLIDNEATDPTLCFFAAAFAAVMLLSNAEAYINSILSLNRVSSFQQDGKEAIRARDTLRHARLRRRRVHSGGVLNFSLDGDADIHGAGIYSTRIKLGSPPREFNVIVDTGSDELWVGCNPCIDCPRSSQLGIESNVFDPDKSHSSSLIICSEAVCNDFGDCDSQSYQCGFNLGYGDGSGNSGYFLTDLLHLNEFLPNSSMKNNPTPIVFGCSTHKEPVDGILGLGHFTVSVISQLSSQKITPNIFSHCLKGDGGGVLVLGEILDERIVHTPLDLSRSHYNLYLESISVGEKPLPINTSAYKTSDRMTTFVDSGSTLVYLVSEAYDSLISVVTDAVSYHATSVTSGHFQCFKLLSSRGIEMFPPVGFHFAGNASLVLTAKEYLLDFGPVDGFMSRCIGFQRALHTYLDANILGELILKNKIVVYDIAHQRFGWADYDCDKEVHVSTTYDNDDYNAAYRASKISS